MEKLNLPLASDKLALMLAAHLGSGDEAHLPADRQRAGFLYPEQFKKFMSAVGERQAPEQIDINKLKPGRYAGVGFTNGLPGEENAGLAYIDVDKIDDDHKMIKQTVSYNGKSYAKVTHGSNDALPNGFGEIRKCYTLWEGGISRQGTTFQLSDSVNKFDELEFTVCTTTKVDVIKVKRRDNMVITTRPDLVNATTGVAFYECLFDVEKDNPTRITLSSNISYAMYDKLITNSDIAEIWKIRGIS